jgi:hypothetical protein
MDKFIKLTSADDSSTVVINTKYIVKVTQEEDSEYSTLIMSDEYSDVEVEESPDRVYTLLTRVAGEKSGGPSAFGGNPESPPRASTQALTNDTHMENLAKHA